MTRRLVSLSLLLAAVLPAMVLVAMGSGPTSPARGSVGRHGEVSATPAIEAPLAVLPLRASVDDRQVGKPTEPWRVLALGTVVTMLIAVLAVASINRRPRRPLRLDPARRWARFRAPPIPSVPTLRG